MSTEPRESKQSKFVAPFQNDVEAPRVTMVKFDESKQLGIERSLA